MAECRPVRPGGQRQVRHSEALLARGLPLIPRVAVSFIPNQSVGAAVFVGRSSGHAAGPIRLLARERSRALIHDQISATVPYRMAFRTGAANQSVTRNGGHVIAAISLIASTVEDCGAVKNTKANATHTAPTRNPAAVAKPIDRFMITTLRVG